MFNKDFVVFDVETTGLNPESDEIIEIGLVRVSHGEITDKVSWLVNPGFLLPKSITDLTGISNEMLADKPSFIEVAQEVENFFLGANIAAHNISFDESFVSKHIYFGRDTLRIDTLDLAKILLPCANNYTLENIAQELMLPTKNLHRAGDDAELTAQVFIKLCELAVNLPIEALTAMIKIFPDDALKNFFQQALKEKVKNSVIGSKTSFLRNLTLTPKPWRDEDEDYKLDSEEILAWYNSNSPLQKENENFEVREPQINMAKAVIEAFNAEKYAVIEAGTGTGKSLAYLLPAAKYAFHSGKRVAVATNTISLQEQLLSKDIPQLAKVGIQVNTALLKGRSHYLCLRKLFSYEEFSELTHEEALALAKIYCWLGQTESGDKGELNYSPKANNLWRLVASDSESCIGSKCKWYAKNCFFWHARRAAELADILVINHALLLSDCSSDKKVLPEFSCLIVDEAHHLEQAAGEHLGSTCDFVELSYTLNRFLSSNKNEGYSVLGKIRKQFLSMPEQEQVYTARLLSLIDEMYGALEQVRLGIQNIKEGLNGLLQTQNMDYRQVLRIKQGFLDNPLWRDIFEKGALLVNSLQDVFKSLQRFILELDDFPNEIGDKEQWELEINNYLQYFRDTIATLTVFFSEDTSREIKWIEYDSDLNESLILKYVPYDIGSILKNALYDRCQTIIFTSATLTVAKKFDYYLSNMGLNLIDEKVGTLEVGSNFNYEKQALVTVPSDIGNPQINENKFLSGVINFIEDIYSNFKGRTLVLFTSHKQLRFVYENINLPEDVLLLGQSISGSRNKILQSFCSNDNACLFGANTFWEGIDLPGDLLNLLIIVKLPFLPPTFPLLEAKVERAEESGENAFQKVTLPGAVIRFKQGFGRLIRRSSDKGAVIILDNRVTSKKYGFTFLRSLPIKTFYTAPKEEVLTKIFEWFAAK